MFKNNNYLPEFKAHSNGEISEAGGLAGILNGYVNATDQIIGFGLFLASEKEKEVVTLTKDTDISNIIGITPQSQITKVFHDNTTGFEPNKMLDVLEEGDIYVNIVKQCTYRNSVHFYVEGPNVGKATGVADTTEGSTTVELKHCMFMTSAPDNGLALIRIRMQQGV
jgi:hypothetical protein